MRGKKRKQRSVKKDSSVYSPIYLSGSTVTGSGGHHSGPDSLCTDSLREMRWIISLEKAVWISECLGN